MDNDFHNRVNEERISSRQIDELIGLTRGLLADGTLNQKEIEFLHKWLAANTAISSEPVINTLYRRIDQVLADGVVDADEMAELFDTLNRFSNRDSELGEPLKATTLPLCAPAPALQFAGQQYTFTGTFNFGVRKVCEAAVKAKGATFGSLSQKTNILVIGTYATDSWKHSSFGLKIMQAAEWRDRGLPISIISEEHWLKHL